MRKSIKGLLGLLSLVFVLGFATEVEAKLYHIVKVETIGGYTAYSATVDVWYQSSGGGKGYIRSKRSYHSGETVYMTGSLTRSETIDLWWQLYRARPWQNAEVKSTFLNVDLPNVKVTYRGRYEQLIRADLAAFSLPEVSQEMDAALDTVWEYARRVADEPLAVYQAAGGLAGLQQTVTIAQGGKVTVETSMAMQPATSLEGWIGSDDLNEIRGLGRGWWGLPSSYDWAPGVIVFDGISYSVEYYRWGFSKEISSKTLADEDQEFSDMVSKIYDVVDEVEDQNP